MLIVPKTNAFLLRFNVYVKGQPFDSWGGGAMFFCEKKDCSANFGK